MPFSFISHLVNDVLKLLSHVLLFSTPGSSVHGIFQARILEQVSISYLLQRIFPNLGTEPASPALAGRVSMAETHEKPLVDDPSHLIKGLGSFYIYLHYFASFYTNFPVSCLITSILLL